MRDVDGIRLAIAEARAALRHDDVPIGAVAVKSGEVIARAHNRREVDQDPTAHAEILLLRKVAKKLDSWRLGGVTVFVTLEPCAMCAGAIVGARVSRVVYGAFDEKAGAALSRYNIVMDKRLGHECKLTAGVLADECAALLSEFFAGKRGPRTFL